MFQPAPLPRPRIGIAFLACFSALPLLAQAPPPATAPPAHSVQPPDLLGAAQGYAEFELGKWAELQAELHGGDYAQQALDHYTAAMAADPQSAYIASQMADLLSRMGRDADATALAQRVTQQHPSSLVAHQTLGTIYLRQLSQARQPIAGTVIEAAVAEYKTLIQLDPANAGNQIILGKLYGAQGDAAGAERQFRAALLIAPTNIDALASLVQSLAGQGRLDQAQQEIDALPPAARSGQVYATLGRAYARQHRYAEAARSFRQAVEARPDDPDFQGELAQALLEGGDLHSALAEYQRLELETPDDGHAALHVAQIQLQLRQLPEAAASLASARRLLGADNLEVDYAGALLAEGQGHPEDAVTTLRALVDRKTSPATQSIFLDQLARMQMRSGDYAASLETAHKLEALGGSYAARAHGLEIEIYSEQRDFTQALATARASLQEQPDSRSLHITYANLLAASGQIEAAEAEIQPLLHGGAADQDLYLALGQIDQAAQRWTQAMANTTRADQLASTPAEHAQAADQLGAIEGKQQEFSAAEQSYRRALGLDPDRPDTLNALGYLLAQQGVRLPEALGYVRQALAHDPDNGAYLDSLGWIYFKMNRLPEAVAQLERAASIERHDPAILDHLAEAYARDGQLQQAETRWSQALADLKLNPAADVGAEQTLAIEKKLDQVRTRIANAHR